MTSTVAPDIPVDAAPPVAVRPVVRGAGLLAVAVVAQPVLLGINSVFHPEVELDAASYVSAAAEDPAVWFVVHVVAALGALVGAPAALGLRRLVRDRGRVLADVAVGCALVAAVVLSFAFMAEASVLRVLVTSDLPPASAEAAVDTYMETPEFVAVVVGLLAATAAAVLFAWALLRERRVPRWMPAVLLVGTVATSAGPPGTPVTPIGFAVVATAAVGLARRIARG